MIFYTVGVRALGFKMKASGRDSKLRKKLEEAVKNRKKPRGRRFYAAEILHLQELLLESSPQNAARELHQNGARTPLFRLQALSRLYEKTGGGKIFYRLRFWFKKIEDALGVVAYFEDLKLYCADREPLQPLVDSFQKKYDIALQELQGLLIDEGWLKFKSDRPSSPRCRRVWKILKKVKWDKNEKERKKIAEFLSARLEKIDFRLKNGLYDFENLEGGLHELRRNIRWFSIYAHSLQGLIQLRGDVRPFPELEMYCPASIRQSPFNTWGPYTGRGKPIQISRGLFFALSFAIAELGRLKDIGQFREALEKEVRTLEFPDDSMRRQALDYLHEEFAEAPELPEKSRAFCEDIFLKKGVLRLLAQDIRNDA